VGAMAQLLRRTRAGGTRARTVGGAAAQVERGPLPAAAQKTNGRGRHS